MKAKKMGTATAMGKPKIVSACSSVPTMKANIVTTRGMASRICRRRRTAKASFECALLLRGMLHDLITNNNVTTLRKA